MRERDKEREINHYSNTKPDQSYAGPPKTYQSIHRDEALAAIEQPHWLNSAGLASCSYTYTYLTHMKKVK
jgi:hypothetical protein